MKYDCCLAQLLRFDENLGATIGSPMAAFTLATLPATGDVLVDSIFRHLEREKYVAGFDRLPHLGQRTSVGDEAIRQRML